MKIDDIDVYCIEPEILPEVPDYPAYPVGTTPARSFQSQPRQRDRRLWRVPLLRARQIGRRTTDRAQSL